VELYLHSTNTPSWSDAQFKKKHRDNFYLIGYIGANGRINVDDELRSMLKYSVQVYPSILPEGNVGMQEEIQSG
jgi:hypothetical protein